MVRSKSLGVEVTQYIPFCIMIVTILLVVLLLHSYGHHNTITETRPNSTMLSSSVNYIRDP